MKKNVCFFIFMLFLGLQSGFSQEPVTEDSLYQVETTDGNEFIGRILSEDEESVRLLTQALGEINIPRGSIRRMRQLKGELGQDGSLWLENPQAARYFWAPNGYGLKEGEGYYQNVWVLFNQASIGINDYISVGAGLMPLFLFAGASTPIWITPKFSVPVIQDKFNVGGGALLGAVLGEDEMGFGIAYGVSTFGSRDRNVSMGLGFGYAGGEWTESPIVNISGIYRTGKNGYILTENYYIDTGGENVLLISFGGRRMIKRVGLDFGLFIPISSDIDDFFIALPWLGFSVPFGNAD